MATTFKSRLAKRQCNASLFKLEEALPAATQLHLLWMGWKGLGRFYVTCIAALQNTTRFTQSGIALPVHKPIMKSFLPSMAMVLARVLEKQNPQLEIRTAMRVLPCACHSQICIAEITEYTLIRRMD